MAIDTRNGQMEQGTSIQEFIEYLQHHMEVYGDNGIDFRVHGEEDDLVIQFDHYKNSLTINIDEDF